MTRTCTYTFAGIRISTGYAYIWEDKRTERKDAETQKQKHAWRSFAEKRRYYHNNGWSHHLLPGFPTHPDAAASSRSSAVPVRMDVSLLSSSSLSSSPPPLSCPNSCSVYIYKFKMIILSVGVANRGHLRPFSVPESLRYPAPCIRERGEEAGAVPTAAAATTVVDRPIMPSVKTGHGVSRLSDARNSRASSTPTGGEDEQTAEKEILRASASAYALLRTVQMNISKLPSCQLFINDN